MKVAFNTMMKNEARLLNSILPIWKNYPVDMFIFYDDNSTDDSISIIKRHLGEDRCLIINDKLPKFNESYHRQKMIDVSRELNFDFVFSIDCDELLTSSIVDNFSEFLKLYETHDVWLYWYNSVNNRIDQYRTDPQYINNFRSFVLPLKNTLDLDTSQWKYHTPRVPQIVDLQRAQSRYYGVIHLQAINTKFYVLKQLWYKHYESLNYNHDIDFINNRYDSVVNQLIFNPRSIDPMLIKGINFDVSVFDDLAEEKGYLKFIKENYNKQLVTFGREYIDE
tara:strand:- start:15475 stop:16311 length:837 start_codon:yes stop_codon:yes gene_type:complete